MVKASVKGNLNVLSAHGKTTRAASIQVNIASTELKIRLAALT
jgi:hypothetical protein